MNIDMNAYDGNTHITAKLYQFGPIPQIILENISPSTLYNITIGIKKNTEAIPFEPIKIIKKLEKFNQAHIYYPLFLLQASEYSPILPTYELDIVFKISFDDEEGDSFITHEKFQLRFKRDEISPIPISHNSPILKSMIHKYIPDHFNSSKLWTYLVNGLISQSRTHEESVHDLVSRISKIFTLFPNCLIINEGLNSEHAMIGCLHPLFLLKIYREKKLQVSKIVLYTEQETMHYLFDILCNSLDRPNNTKLANIMLRIGENLTLLEDAIEVGFKHDFMHNRLDDISSLMNQIQAHNSINPIVSQFKSLLNHEEHSREGDQNLKEQLNSLKIAIRSSNYS